ncbi:uncharacterized protein [Anoplolepis gracilipes]|uniref:uncharacterized protein isoform X6 n=1 Tax=Anoplolepis gracilipes TaxID=354296 RepID=UPI003B9F864F
MYMRTASNGSLIIAELCFNLRNEEIKLIIAQSGTEMYPRGRCNSAHGKRNDASTMRILAAKTLRGTPQNNIARSSKAQWILSRLIAGQPVLPLTDKYPVRWNGFPNDKTFIPSKWDTAPLNDDSTISVRVPINNENEKNKRKISNTQDTMLNMNEKLENIPEILLVSDEYDKPINNPQKLDIFKLLNEETGNMK